MSATDASEQTIFDAARQLTDPQARAAYLESVCAGKPELRQRLESLLQASLRADEFLAGDPLDLGPTCQANAAQPLPGEGPGTVIDKYKLLEQIGEGGFGVVYMAEQKQPLKRRVALKIIKVGMDTREVVARYEAERQALAELHWRCTERSDSSRSSAISGSLSPAKKRSLTISACSADCRPI